MSESIECYFANQIAKTMKSGGLMDFTLIEGFCFTSRYGLHFECDGISEDGSDIVLSRPISEACNIVQYIPIELINRYISGSNS